MEKIDRAVAAHEEAVRLCDSGDRRRATRAARRAVALFTECDGPRHPDVAGARLILGRALELGDGWKAALDEYTRAGEILCRYSRLAHPEIRRLSVKTLRARCCVLRILGRYGEASRDGARAIALARRWFGQRDLDFAGALNDLGMVRKYQGRYAEAPPLYRRSLAILEGAGLGATADAASIYHNLGGIEHARGRYAQAEAPARKAVVLRTRALGAHHPSTAADMAALAAIVEQRGRLGEASTLYRRALAIFRRFYGPRCYEVGVNTAGLAGILHARRRLDEAEREYRRALLIHERLFGPRHVEVALTLNNLSQVIYDQALVTSSAQVRRRRAREAIRCGARALAAFREAAGPRHHSTIVCAANLASMREASRRA
jgi:tetratricopeptide (TPR) repeat protein